MIVGLGFAVAAAAQQAPPPPLPSVELPQPLDRVLRDYEARWKAKDGAGLATLFTTDGFVMSANELPVRGRPSIEERYRRSSGGDLRLRALGFAIDDTVGYIVGGYRYQPTGGDVGKFVLALRKGPGGTWLIAADIDNGNGRPPQ
jgi:ketosteroid isomerase-like protein